MRHAQHLWYAEGFATVTLLSYSSLLNNCTVQKVLCLMHLLWWRTSQA